MGLIQRLFSKDRTVYGAPPPVEMPTAPPLGATPGRVAPPQFTAVDIPDIAASLRAAAAVPRLTVVVALPSPLDGDAMRALDAHVAAVVVMDPAVASAAGMGDVINAQAAATRIAELEVQRYFASLPPQATTAIPPPATPQTTRLMLEIPLDRIGSPIETSGLRQMPDGTMRSDSANS